jgi:predicted ATPase
MTQTSPQLIPDSPNNANQSLGLTEIGVSGFKSFAEETRIQLGSLTILAGANSSGKSSIMQPLLLMKQTLEAPYDPGALLLDGPNISFTSGEQFISKDRLSPNASAEMTVELKSDSRNESFCSRIRTVFLWSLEEGTVIKSQTYTSNILPADTVLRPGMSSEELRKIVPFHQQNLFSDHHQFYVVRDRCFLKAMGGMEHRFESRFSGILRSLIYVRGLRGIPERVYKTAAISGSAFMGQFENYVASIIDRFQKENPEKLVKLQQALQKLGLTDLVQTQRLNDTQIELRVGRVLGQTDPTDTVNIADVGFGVSQVLPVIVALLVAQPGQLVYIEQPEIHLHPRAQIALSEIFADAANRGVRVVVETHSELFLLGVQSLVAEDKLDPKEVKLHWFTRNSDGSSKVTSAELDTTGAFGDWPEDFGMTALALENRYLSAAEAKLWNAGNGRSPN